MAPTFQGRQELTEDDARIGRPKTSVSGDNLEIIKKNGHVKSLDYCRRIC